MPGPRGNAAATRFKKPYQPPSVPGSATTKTAQEKVQRANAKPKRGMAKPRRYLLGNGG